MTFLFGALGSFLAGYSGVKSKAIIERMDLGEYQRITSLLSLVTGLPMYFILSQIKTGTELVPVNIGSVLLLVAYLAFRIVSNLAQNSLARDKDTDLTLTNVILSTGCFLSLGMISSELDYRVFIPIVTVIIGSLIAVTDFRSMRFKLSRKSSLLLVIAYIVSGTKPYMAYW